MSATRQNVANFCPDRSILATWFTVCWHTFVSLFPNIDIPRTDDNCVCLLLVPTSNLDTKKSSAASIPSRHVFFTSCRVVASHHMRFVCLFVRSFVRLVGCCIVSLPFVIASRPVMLPCHVLALRHVSCHPSHLIVVQSLRRCVVASLRCRVLSRLIVVSRPLTHLVTPTLFDCCVVALHLVVVACSVLSSLLYCRHHPVVA